MAYVPGQRNDVFLSYCHGDNFLIGSDKGWIATFHESLRNRLAQLLGAPVEVWLDKRQLNGVQALDQTLEIEIDGAATFLAVVSPLYLSSNYCTKERERFLMRGPERLEVGEYVTAIRVVKTPSPDDGHRRVFERCLGFEFFTPDGASFREFSIFSSDFSNAMEDIAKGIATLLGRLWRSKTAVYVGACSDDRAADRARLVQQLEAWGYRVVPSTRVSADNLEAVGRDALGEALASVHLFGDEPAPVPIAEATLAMTVAKPMLTWLSQSKPLDQKDNYALFLQRVENHLDPSRRSQFIARSRLESVKDVLQQVLLPGALSAPVRSAEERRVYVVCDTRNGDDYARARKIRNVIRDLPRFEVDLPDAGLLDPGELRAEHERKLSRADGVLLYWGKAGDDWFHTVERDLDRRAYRSGAIATQLDSPAIPNRLVLPLGDEFGSSELEPFLRPLL